MNKLSVIIPAHNCRNTISRLLDSIVVQDYPDAEVIICDDWSEDGFMELVVPYMQMLNIVYLRAERHRIHCPGNTRRDGLAAARGEWVTFIDHDDEFMPRAFSSAFRAIEEHEEERLLVSRCSIVDNGTPVRESDAMTWLHGKFYNRKFLVGNGINFLEDMESHEDLWFNSHVYAAVLDGGDGYTTLPVPTYNWIYNPASESNKFNETDRMYIEEYMDDYLQAGTAAWLDLLERRPDLSEDVRCEVISVLLYAYLYWQNIIYRHAVSHTELTGTAESSIKKHIGRVAAYGITLGEIISRAYDHPQEFSALRDSAVQSLGPFVETQSCIDFFEKMADGSILPAEEDPENG